MSPAYRVEQCSCGLVARVPVGEDKPWGWRRMLDGSLRCEKCERKS